MPLADYAYYSRRCAKQRRMAMLAQTETVLLTHQRLARAYASKAASAMHQYLCPPG